MSVRSLAIVAVLSFVGCVPDARAPSVDAACMGGSAQACLSIAALDTAGAWAARPDYRRALVAAEHLCLLDEKHGCDLQRELVSARATWACRDGALSECLAAVEEERSFCAKTKAHSECHDLAEHATAVADRACRRGAAECRAVCDTGLASACTALAKIYLTKDSWDFPRASAAAKRACDLGEKEPCGLALEFAKGLCGSGNSLANCMAVEQSLRTSCAGGMSDACAAELALSKRASYRVCTEGSIAECNAACDGGVPHACERLAKIYVDGTRLPTDAARAIKLLERECKGGDSDACLALGQSYRGSCSLVDSCVYLERACDRGDPGGCSALMQSYGGTCSQVDVCVDVGTPDKARAATYFDEVCTAGIARGCEDLSDLVTDYGLSLANDARKRLFDELDRHCQNQTIYACTCLAKTKLAAPVDQRVRALRVLCANHDDEACGRLRDLGEKP